MFFGFWSIISICEYTDRSPQSRRGRTVTIKGKVYHANKDRYALIVHKASLVSYRSLIGFTILRKRERLDSAVAQLDPITPILIHKAWNHPLIAQNKLI